MHKFQSSVKGVKLCGLLNNEAQNIIILVL